MMISQAITANKLVDHFFDEIRPTHSTITGKKCSAKHKNLMLILIINLKQLLLFQIQIERLLKPREKYFPVKLLISHFELVIL